MRKENMTAKRVHIAHVAGYHHNAVNQGFKKGLLYCNSDRVEKILSNGLREKSGQEPEGYGLEVETQSATITSSTILAELYDKIVFTHFRFPEMWKMQSDISLGGRSSAECITGIMTKSRIRNDYQAWKLMFDTYFPQFGISADTYNTTCGMHINISNACFGKTTASRETAIRKFYYIVNKHYDIIRRMVYRAHNKTTYCGQMPYSVAKTMDLHNMDPGHDNCFNGSHYDAGRIEFRLPGGQKDFDTFLKTMETAFFLVDRVKTITWQDCDKIEKIFEGCNQAVFARFNHLQGVSAEAKDHVRETVKHDADLDIFNV